VGAGIAGVKAAEAIRTVDENGSILLLSAEDRLPYKRTKIDKHLYCGFAAAQFSLHPQSWFEDLGSYYFSLNYERYRHLEQHRFTAGAIRQTWFAEAGTVMGVVMKNDKDRAKIYETAVLERWPIGRMADELGL
jgi:hypothetical protein